MVGIQRVQTHPVNWTLNARVLLWLEHVWVNEISFQYLLNRESVHRDVNACRRISLTHEHVDIFGVKRFLQQSVLKIILYSLHVHSRVPVSLDS